MYVTCDLYKKKYSDVFKGDSSWWNIEVPESETYMWDEKSTYVRNPPYFETISKRLLKEEIKDNLLLHLEKYDLQSYDFRIIHPPLLSFFDE